MAKRTANASGPRKMPTAIDTTMRPQAAAASSRAAASDRGGAGASGGGSMNRTSSAEASTGPWSGPPRRASSCLAAGGICGSTTIAVGSKGSRARGAALLRVVRLPSSAGT